MQRLFAHCRFQRFVIGRFYSPKCSAVSLASQASVLMEPILFTICINVIDDVSRRDTALQLFTDDAEEWHLTINIYKYMLDFFYSVCVMAMCKLLCLV